MNSNESQQDRLSDDWLELGAEVIEFICKRLNVNTDYIDVASAGREAAFLAKGVGLSAHAFLQHEIAKVEAKKTLKRLGGCKSEPGQVKQPNETNQQG